jgi:hypothetical protein
VNKISLCKKLIKVANQLDKYGDYDSANELTKIAASFGQEFMSSFVPNLAGNVLDFYTKGMPSYLKNPALMQAFQNRNMYSTMPKPVPTTTDQATIDPEIKKDKLFIEIWNDNPYFRTAGQGYEKYKNVKNLDELMKTIQSDPIAQHNGTYDNVNTDPRYEEYQELVKKTGKK